MMDLDFTFRARLWEYKGQGSWHFLTLPKDISADIKAFTKHTVGGPRKSFRTVKVLVTIGKSEWSTSLFPDSKSCGYLLPVKAAIRKAEGLKDGDELSVTLSVVF